MLARRTGGKKEAVSLVGITKRLEQEMADMQKALLDAARDRREANSIRGATRDDLIARMEGPGGFVYGGFCGDDACEAEIKEQTKATIRVLPDAEFRSAEAPTHCLWCGRPSVAEAVWAKAY
jgi:prolyl-tRNA synthetase